MPKSRRHDRLAALQRKMPPLSDPHGVRRFIALCFRFHAACENRACRRAAQCVGEKAECFDAFWWDLPEIRKDCYREMIKARIAGALTREEIQAVAFANIMARYTPEEIREAAAQVTKGGQQCARAL